MELRILEKKEKPLLARTEVSGDLSFTGATPSNAETRKKLAEILKADENSIVIKQILTKFGGIKATFSAYAYKSPADREKIEVVPKKQRKAAAEAKKKEEAAKKEEKPAEAKEAKEEEPKPEEKKEEKPAEKPKEGAES